LANPNCPDFPSPRNSFRREFEPLEHAIKRITSEPARFFGIKDRGRLAHGLAADITIFDFNTVNSGSRRSGATIFRVVAGDW
jgi:N-acyl-D-aspartate/D-glutamate deacylase